MQILSIEDCIIDQEADYCYVEAIIDESVLTRGQTLLDPPEYGPARCKASFNIEDTAVPEDEHNFKLLLESLSLDWRVCEPPDMFDENDLDQVF